MENFILLMLFTYPGAVSYWIYNRFAKDKTFYVEPDSFSRSAICFFLSVVVTLLSLGIVAVGSELTGLSEIINQITESRAIWSYAIWSLVVSIAVGLLWFFLKSLKLKLLNKYKVGTKSSADGYYKTVWTEFVKTYDIKDCALIIRRNGRFVAAGFPDTLPEDIGEDKSIILSYQDNVENEYNKPGHGILGGRVVTYYDVGADTEFEFISCVDLKKKIRKAIKSAGL